ncbi:hypothetical protein L798_09049 [Zootermopsis nevadensis]|uniref:Uncharacterized protein n=1 Tax=Zootermopsis nevadensis TaxID=136037 RepID=A0A067R2G2_ZOONE|nr:hypothetical protein L798_09049 [Zootermopsis nevadensis]
MIRRGAHYVRTVARDTVDMEIRVGSIERHFHYNNHESLARDIEFIIFLFAERGSTYEKFVNKSLPAVRTVMDWLVQKYNLDITVHAPLTALDPDVVTIPRIVVCFPAKICEYYNRGFGKNLLSFQDLNIPGPDYPSRSILCPHFTALISMTYIEHR